MPMKSAVRLANAVRKVT